MTPHDRLESFLKTGRKVSVAYLVFFFVVFLVASSSGSAWEPRTDHTSKIEYSRYDKKTGASRHVEFYVTSSMARVLSAATLPLYPIGAFLLLWLVALLIMTW